MKKIILCIVSLALVFCTFTSAMAGKLVYANDANGNCTYGDIQKLIDAVMTAKQVRVMGWDDTSSGYCSATRVWVKGTIVYAQCSEVISEFQGDLLMPIYGSITYNVDTKGNSTFPSGSVGHASYKWFID